METDIDDHFTTMAAAVDHQDVVDVALATRQAELAARGEYTYVLIPHEAHKPMQEFKHPCNTTLEDDDLREALKLHFSQTGTLTEAQLAAHCWNLKQQIHEKSPETPVRDEDLLAVASGVNVDTFAMTVPDKTHLMAVSLYADDKGHAKNAPINERACGLAQGCGHANQSFRGDCFVSRYFDDDDAWIRKDFKIEDCSSDAQWVTDQKAITKKSPGGMASLSDMYAKLGQKSGGAPPPVKFDQREEEKKLLLMTRGGDGYTWTQTNTEVEIRVAVPAGTVARALTVAIKRGSLLVSLGEASLLNVDRLTSPIDVDESTWYLDDGEVIFTLEKQRPGAWDELGDRVLK